MFELPDAKRVKRSKLFATSSSSEDEADDAHRSKDNSSTSKAKSKSNEKHNERTPNDQQDFEGDEMKVDYGFEYEFIDKTEPIIATKQQQVHQSVSKSTEEDTEVPSNVTEAEEPREQTFAFNLFAPKPKTPSTTTSTSRAQAVTQEAQAPTQQTNTITIRSPTPPSLSASATAGRIVKPRAQSHYFTASLPSSTKSSLQTQYTESAISGPSILSQSSRAWPGTHLPWRVITIKLPSPGQPTPTSTQAHPSTRPGHARARPSKKRRDQHRQRLATRAAAKLAGQAAEEADREKRTRRNREKKVKRKLREKAKKVDGAGVAAGVEDAAGAGSGDGDSSS